MAAARTPFRSAATFLAGILPVGLLLLGACATSESAPCLGVECCARGFCVADQQAAYCACIRGFHPVGLCCEANVASDPCAGVDCTGHGTCRVEAGMPTCDCEPGYQHLADSELLCTPVPLDGGREDGARTDADADTPAEAEAEAGADADAPVPESCINGVDDDGDTLTDCADLADCDTQACGGDGLRCAGGSCGCPGGATESACSDGSDNDCDGLTDCADGDCVPVPPCSSSLTEVACADGVDNDGDGSTDCADTDCNGAACGSGGRICSGGSCACPSGSSESSCTDGLDNDCDGMTDCADADCNGVSCGSNGRVCSGGSCACPGGSSESNCADGRDNDCDGDTDCADSQCNDRVCANDGTLCGGTKDCHKCIGGVCALNDGHWDASCTPSCGVIQTFCGTPTDCCGAGSTCGSGSAGPSRDCDVCCTGGCGCAPTETSETTCGDGVDNDCDGSTDCADGDCAGFSCDPYGSYCYLSACCYPSCSCDCGWNDNGCGSTVFCGDCGGAGYCDGCYCY
jgi:hypothetical protein